MAVLKSAAELKY